MHYCISKPMLVETFEQLRRCGRGRRECQALWISAWTDVPNITGVVHPCHGSSAVGFNIDDAWIDKFWTHLAVTNSGIRFQIHTHPNAAFHSPTDDAYPIIQRPGFLSLVIPNFALDKIGFEGAYLAEIQEGGKWQQVPIAARLEVT